jgi:hypothetical protein
MAPVGNGGFVALASPSCGLLKAPPDGLEEAADMGGMVPDTEGQMDDDSHACSCPDLPAKAIGFGTPVQERGQAGQLVG